MTQIMGYLNLEGPDGAYLALINEVAEDVAKSIPRRIEQQLYKHGLQRMDGYRWLGVSTEELGEFVQAYNQKHWAEAFAEGEQLIACITRMMVEIKREFMGLNTTEAGSYVRPV